MRRITRAKMRFDVFMNYKSPDERHECHTHIFPTMHGIEFDTHGKSRQKERWHRTIVHLHNFDIRNMHIHLSWETHLLCRPFRSSCDDLSAPYTCINQICFWEIIQFNYTTKIKTRGNAGNGINCRRIHVMGANSNAWNLVRSLHSCVCVCVHAPRQKAENEFVFLIVGSRGAAVLLYILYFSLW